MVTSVTTCEFASAWWTGSPWLRHGTIHTLYARARLSNRRGKYQQCELSSSRPLLIKVAAGLDNRVVSIRYLSWAYQLDESPMNYVTAHPTLDWSRLGIKMRTRGTEYALIVEKRNISWDFWFSKSWLCGPVKTHMLRMSSELSLEDAISLPYSNIRRRYESHRTTHFPRRIRYEYLCSAWSFMHLKFVFNTI